MIFRRGTSFVVEAVGGRDAIGTAAVFGLLAAAEGDEVVVVTSLRVAFFAVMRLFAQITGGREASNALFAVETQRQAGAEAAAARDATFGPRAGNPEADAVRARAFLRFGHFGADVAVGRIDGLEFLAGPVAAKNRANLRGRGGEGICFKN